MSIVLPGAADRAQQFGRLGDSPPAAAPPATVPTPATTATATTGVHAPARPIPPPRAGQPTVARDRAELRAALATADRTVRAVVMTMGALHEGHATLLRAARAQADQLVATIFVNPLQFGAGEDLDRYPRTFEADLELCAREGVDVVFAPMVIHEVPPMVRLSAGPLGEILEGASRPGHFDGMLTLVGTMLHLVRADLAFFGRKDAQQLVCIRRMVADLAFDVSVIGVDTVREPDGLALSSRNAYLTAGQRADALALSRALAAGAAAADAGGGPAAVLQAARAVLDVAAGVDVDYLELAGPDDLGPVTAGPALLLVAARVGTTRLIDNISLVLPADCPGV
ncbi:pantoate--beta-alanine ligase [Frankia sp. AgB32]|uniref:pantoate--beta-alanine ligase n=1 Tax=Frankia sp. AgB32 TaxID=631119 RepID=UPI00200D0DA1|nr:pantoate--beta-alanine ligase [Frankia sp. AgB32]MCK9894305.1 pantoate--beta-alanine ligase [Frankia sp. AgB32]